MHEKILLFGRNTFRRAGIFLFFFWRFYARFAVYTPATITAAPTI